MNPRVLAFPIALLSGCESLTGIKPSSALCHGYASQDSVTTRPDGSADTTQITRAHLCGMPRQYAVTNDRKKAA